MTDEPEFRPATAEDAPVLAQKIREVSPDVVDTLLKGLLPGIGVENILSMALRDESSHYSFRNCVLSEVDGALAGLLFAYPAELQGIPNLMEHMVPSSRLEPLRELLTISEPGSLYVNTLWVAEDFRGQGMADALIEYARFWAGSLECSAVSLFCWRDNARAVSFYRRQGFRPVRELVAKPPLTEKHDRGDLYVLPVADPS